MIVLVKDSQCQRYFCEARNQCLMFNERAIKNNKID